jgi:hypothetical protein
MDGEHGGIGGFGNFDGEGGVVGMPSVGKLFHE